MVLWLDSCCFRMATALEVGNERLLEVDEAVSEVTTYMNMSGMLMLLMFASLGSSQG